MRSTSTDQLAGSSVNPREVRGLEGWSPVSTLFGIRESASSIGSPLDHSVQIFGVGEDTHVNGANVDSSVKSGHNQKVKRVSCSTRYVDKDKSEVEGDVPLILPIPSSFVHGETRPTDTRR